MKNNYRYVGNIKGFIFLVGVFLVIGLFSYTGFLSRELREDNREVVKLYAEIIAGAVNDDSNSNIDFIFENIIKKVKFPIIQSDTKKNPQLWTNLPKDVNTYEEKISFIKSMDVINEPIPLVYFDQESEPITFGFLHYGDSSLIQKIKIWTYVEIISIGLFICIGFVGFSYIRHSEKQNIWIGLSRETAHQLGTPVSALLGWLDYLKHEKTDLEKILPEIESDIERLQQVNRRFSKMGSKPEVEYFNLSKRISSTLEYLEKRMPSLGGKVILVNKIGPDAINKENGKIEVALKQDVHYVKIHITDNGCGIPKKDWKNIFRPGFTTKNSGWGLGLSLCERIINDVHGGKVSVLASSISEGTTFEIAISKS